MRIGNSERETSSKTGEGKGGFLEEGVPKLNPSKEAAVCGAKGGSGGMAFREVGTAGRGAWRFP